MRTRAKPVRIRPNRIHGIRNACPSGPEGCDASGPGESHRGPHFVASDVVPENEKPRSLAAAEPCSYSSARSTRTNWKRYSHCGLMCWLVRGSGWPTRTRRRWQHGPRHPQHTSHHAKNHQQSGPLWPIRRPSRLMPELSSTLPRRLALLQATWWRCLPAETVNHQAAMALRSPPTTLSAQRRTPRPLHAPSCSASITLPQPSEMRWRGYTRMACQSGPSANASASAKVWSIESVGVGDYHDARRAYDRRTEGAGGRAIRTGNVGHRDQSAVWCQCQDGAGLLACSR